MCSSPHQGGTDLGRMLPPSPDLAPIRKRLRTFSAQFHDFRAGPGSDCRGLTTDASHHGADRVPRQGNRSILGPLGETRMRKISMFAAALITTLPEADFI